MSTRVSYDLIKIRFRFFGYFSSLSYLYLILLTFIPAVFNPTFNPTLISGLSQLLILTCKLFKENYAGRIRLKVY